MYEYSGQDTSLKIGGSYPSLGKLFFFSITSLPGADPSSYSMRTGVPSPRVKRLRYETEYSLLKFKNAAIHLLSLYTFMAWTRSNVPYRICNNTSEKYKLCSSSLGLYSRLRFLSYPLGLNTLLITILKMGLYLCFSLRERPSFTPINTSDKNMFLYIF